MIATSTPSVPDRYAEAIRSSSIVADALALDASTLRRRATDDLRTLRARPSIARAAWKALRLARDAEPGLSDLAAQFGRSEAVLGLQRGFPPCCDRAMAVRRIAAALIELDSPEGGAA